MTTLVDFGDLVCNSFNAKKNWGEKSFLQIGGGEMILIYYKYPWKIIYVYISRANKNSGKD